jgi:hypothetical protein
MARMAPVSIPGPQSQGMFPEVDCAGVFALAISKLRVISNYCAGTEEDPMMLEDSWIEALGWIKAVPVRGYWTSKFQLFRESIIAYKYLYRWSANC